MAPPPTAAPGVSALDILHGEEQLPIKPVYAVYGDEEFLRAQAVSAITRQVLGDEATEFSLTRLDGDAASLADVLDELATRPFLGPLRLVVVSPADRFVSTHRDALERYVQQPRPSGVLVLVVQSWPLHTRLARLIAQVGLAIDCRSPEPRQLAAWCRRWAQERYQKRLATDAAELLVELAGSGGLGQLDREIDKLASYVGERADVSAQDVDRLVAGGRVAAVWRIIDAAAEGRAAPALEMLDALLVAGEQPVFLLAAMSTQLRRLAKAHRLVRSGSNVRAALAGAGVKDFAAAQAQAQLRHLGRARLEQLLGWLLETDLGMKGDSALTAQHLLERLVVRVAAKNHGAAGR